MDIFDDAEDPLPMISKSNNNNNKPKKFEVNETTSARSILHNKGQHNKINNENPLLTPETFKYLLNTSGDNTLSPRPPMPNTVVVYDTVLEKHYNVSQTQQMGNGTDVKIFWGSVEDAVDSIPFLPFEVNIPDMLSAMSTFFANYMPFINRFTNQNHPRLPLKLVNNQTNVKELGTYYKTYVSEQSPDVSISRREYNSIPKLKTGKRKQNNNNRRKFYKNKNSTTSFADKIFKLPNLSRTTTVSPPPNPDSKLWHVLGTDSKETFKLKNMPITRKRIRIADREIFNFKNSDISNSPIMILNVPQRPITQFKVVHQNQFDKKIQSEKNDEIYEFESSTVKLPSSLQQYENKRKLKNKNKKKSSSKRSGRSDLNEEEITSTH